MVCGIVGLGLMGGSFGLACKGYFDKIIGIDHNIQHQEDALKLGLVDEIGTFEDLKQADVIVLAIPIRGIINALNHLSKLNLKKDSLIIDFGSTKESIVNECPKNIRKNLVASHPMAGTEYSGPQAAIADLYYNKVMVVCNIEDSGEEQVKRAFDIYNYLKMQIKIMDAKEHDRHAAFISHMPHIVSFSIANSVLKQEDKDHIVTLAAGGFRDMSRLAKSNPHMWKDIFKENKKNLLDSIEAFKSELKKAKDMIENEKWEELEEWMKTGNQLHKIM
ncbi:prephenate dehydrogenase [Caminibacter pacificus]|uniref:prephenate dehydrogenase n=1 Tax=Caminibacter pacificus TaxID=1424653 RepID=A0AAJ4UXS1_9BACT|nr:prephenate dehydrogenase [Caminibacter pacificus]NPA87716.1 prephenate dehydrogenase [Campylobacterota bacterium]QCI28921.1 prephenate dehydrogenase [Caminibacter pacificus]ROR39512.1 prephenate dehydrogenase [Caminibacter pacificus]